MFDDYLLNNNQHISANIRIDEHRAPTDQSVKILKELEKAATDKIMSSIRVQDNNFECVIHSFRNPLKLETEFAVVFKLNGQQKIVKYIHKHFNADLTMCLADVRIALRNVVATEIANEIAGAFKSANLW